MVKIFVDKDESVASVVEKIITAEDTHVVLVIPRDSELRESVSNFHLLKREADAGGKNIFIESVDEEVLTLAKMSKIEAVHSLFRRDRGDSAFSDIVGPSSEEGKAGKKKKAVHKRKGLLHLGKQQAEPLEQKPVELREDRKKEEVASTKERKPLHISERAEDRGFEEPPEHQRKRVAAIIGITVAVAVVIVGGLWLFTALFAKADVVVNFRETPWEHNGVFTALVSEKKVDTLKNILPAELFSQEKNLTQLSPASGKGHVERRAVGVVVIYNAYSSKPQELVATTRFETPDGKIFRIDNGVVVPGAEIKDGKVIPSSISAPVTADKPGEEYNVGPTKRLNIPGFKGSPKFKGFYGEFAEPTHGGFIGESAFPTDDDIAAAKKRVTEILKAALGTGISNKLPDGFELIDGASDVKIIRLSVNEETDKQGNFSVFGKAKLTALTFKKADLMKVMSELVKKDYPDKVIKSIRFAYSDVTSDLENGKLTFTLTAEGVLQPEFNEEDFKTAVSGKKEKEVRSYLISNFQDIENATILLKPFWLRRVPADAERISVVIK